MKSRKLRSSVSAALLASMLATSFVALAQDASKTKSNAEKPTAEKSTAEKSTAEKSTSAKPTAVLLVVPVAFASNDQLGKGCWARLYDGGNFTGSQYVLVGPVEVPAMRDGLGINEKYDSIIVGPKATLTVYDNINYRDKSAVLKASSRTPDLDEKMALFETIRSLKVSCAK